MLDGGDLTVRGISDGFKSVDQYSLKGLVWALERVQQECN